MIGGDRGDALLQCATLLGGAMVVYWSCFMDHGDDGLPVEEALDKWWKTSERKQHARGHAARTDPGVMLALRTEAVGRLARQLDLPPEILGEPTPTAWWHRRRLEEAELGMATVEMPSTTGVDVP